MIDANELVLGTPTATTLATGQSDYYKVVVPANETLQFVLTAQDSSAINELYVSYGTMPTRAEYDYRYSQPFQANQSIKIPNSQAGTYYVLVYGSSEPAGTENVSIEASALPFSVASVSPSKVDNTGPSTFEIDGARFDRGTTFQLVDNSNNAIPASATYFQDSGTVYATFDLTGKALGAYSILATSSDGTTSQVTSAVTVGPSAATPSLQPVNGALNGSLETYFTAPSIALPDRIGRLHDDLCQHVVSRHSRPAALRDIPGRYCARVDADHGKRGSVPLVSRHQSDWAGGHPPSWRDRVTHSLLPQRPRRRNFQFDAASGHPSQQPRMP